MARKRPHDEAMFTTQELLDQQLGVSRVSFASSLSSSSSSPPFNLPTIFPAEIISLIFEFYLESPIPIKLTNRLHAEPPQTRKKSDRTKYFWVEAEGVFHGMLSSPSSVALRDKYRARFFSVNTFIVNRMTQYTHQPAENGDPIYVGSVLTDWPDSYEHIRSLIIDGRNIPVHRRDAISRACPNLTHLKILDFRHYVPGTFDRETAAVRRGHMHTQWQRRRKVISFKSCYSPPPWHQNGAPPEAERSLLDLVSHPSLRHIELECENYWTKGTGRQSDAGWFAERVAQRVCGAFGDVERKVRVDVVGKRGQCFLSLCLPTESGSFYLEH